MNDSATIDRKQATINNRNRMREWATPFTIGAFALTAITGILLFFKVNFGLIKPAHEWLSWLLVFGTAFHLVVHWRPTLQYFTRPQGKGILFVFSLLICASFLPVGGGGNRKHPSNAVAEALLHVPLSTVALAANHSLDETREMLKAQGGILTDRVQTVQEVAGGDNKRAMELLTVLF